MKRLVARWESGRGKDWVQLVTDGVRTPFGVCYEAEANGAWGRNYFLTDSEAVKWIQDRVESGMYCSQKSPMKRVEV